MWFGNDVVERPFPEVETPLYRSYIRDEVVQYLVRRGSRVLSTFIKLEFAHRYAEIYMAKLLGEGIYTETIGDEETPFLYAFDTGYDIEDWLYIEKI